MIGYTNTVRDREYKMCTPELFERLVSSPMVKMNIEEYRGGNAAAKSLLPTFLFQGFDPNVLLGKKGQRNSKAMLPTGMFMMDFDHVSTTSPQPSPQGEGVVKVTPAKLFDRFLAKLPALGFDLKRDVALAHITPSGDGLRLVIKTPKNMSIEEAQEWTAKIMGIEYDGVVKDLARLSFCPMREDILYINKALLFAPVSAQQNPVRDNLFVAQGFNPGSQTGGGTPSPSGEACLTNSATVVKEASPKGEDVNTNGKPGVETPRYKEKMPTASTFPSHYRGIPYRRIVDELITLYGGAPAVGGREIMVFRLASDLAKITDRSAPWLETLIPTFGLPEDEWRQTIKQVCKEPLKTSMSKKLQEALIRCKTSDTNNDGVISLDEYKDDFPEKVPALIKLLTSRCMPHMKPALSQMLFPALAAHVGSHKFLMGDNSQQELGIMAVLVGKQSTGKSCIDKPISIITADIKELDKINLQRLKRYNEKRKNRKASERGEAKPEDIIIRCIGGNVTNPALLQLLDAAEKGNPEKPNQCLYSEVTEIQRLLKMGTDGGRLGVAELIKAAFDRATLDSFRATEAAVNAVTPARWNFSAATTPEGADKFFSGTLLTDGTLSRIAFVRMPDIDIPTDSFTLGNYDEEFINDIKPFIQNLNDYKHPTDDNGQPVPLFVPEVNALRQKINAVIDVEKYLYPSTDTYTAYAFRARDIVIRDVLTTWIANGQKWEECDDFWLYMYYTQMDAKLSMFAEKAAERFESEKKGRKGRWTPLRFMKREFTLREFSAVCATAPIKMKRTPERTLQNCISKGFVRREGDHYIISDEVCKMYNIE